MEELSVSELKPGERLDRPLLHASGETLLESGRTITRQTVRTFEEAGIDVVYRPEPGRDPGDFIHNARNTPINVRDLNVGHRSTKPLFDREGTLLMDEDMIISERLAERLEQRGVNWIYVRKDPSELNLNEVRSFRRQLERMERSMPAPIADQIDAARLIKAEDCNREFIDKLVESGGPMRIKPGETPLSEQIQQHDPLEARSDERKSGFMMMYDEAVRRTSRMFGAFRQQREVDESWIGKVTRRVVGALIEDHDLLLNMATLGTPNDPLISQSLGATILSIAVASSSGYDSKQVLEVGYCAYLHDIGMLRVPRKILDKPGKLSALEQSEIHRHTVHNLDLLENLVGHRSGLTGTVPIVAYQSHERENGSGYPKGRKGSVIHDFAKVLSACDTYQAMTSTRPYRPGMLPYQAMEQLLLMAARGILAPVAVKSLLNCMSLFPIGSWVELSDKSIAQVVAGSGSQYTRPVVSVMFRGGELLSRPERINLAEERSLNITRPLPAPAEISSAMEAF